MAMNLQRTIMRVIGAREQTVTVTAVEDLLPWYRRVHFSAPEFMRGLELFPTIWVRLWVPSLDDPAALKQRGYTLVDPDPESGTFALEFVLHDTQGPAAAWARSVTPGDTAEIAFTPMRIAPDPAIGTFVLVGDASALPGINSLLDAAPAGAKTRVVFADDHADAAQLPMRLRDDTVLDLVNSGADLAARLRELDVDRDDCYVWAAGERKAVAAIREVVRREWKLPKDRQHTQYYWIEGKPFG